METSDTAFLVELEGVLTSYDLPLIPLMMPDENDNNKLLQYWNKPASDGSNKVDKRSQRTSVQNTVAVNYERRKANDLKRRREYNKRRQLERESLQNEVDKLKEELKATESKKLLSSWKMKTQRELDARASAGAEQTQMFNAITDQAILIQRFHQRMQQRIEGIGGLPARLDEENIGVMTYNHKKTRLSKSLDAEVFATFIQEVDKLFTQTDETLQACGLNSAEANWGAPTEFCDENIDTGHFKFRGKITLPFDFQDICRSRWQSAHMLYRQESRETYEGGEDPENTIALKFRVTTPLSSGGTASVLQRVVVRRYEEERRMVLVWRLFTEGEGVFSGMHSDETGWGVVTPATDASSSKTGTVLRTCVRNEPMFYTNVTANKPAFVKQFGAKLLEWGMENNTETTLGLEKLLLN